MAPTASSLTPEYAQTQTLSNGISLPADRSKYTFEHYWFDEVIRDNWAPRLKGLRKQKLQVLEIGCFEGASTTWILDNLMEDAGSSLTSIDTFEGGLEHKQPDGQNGAYQLSSLEDRFCANVAKCEQSSKLEVMKARSDNALIKLRANGARFDFVYIDASHTAFDVLHDAVHSWPMLKMHGMMVFDDYTWKGFLQDCYNPRIAIQAFLHCAAPELQSERVDSQIWVTKVPKHIEPIPNPDSEVYYWNEDAGLKLEG